MKLKFLIDECLGLVIAHWLIENNYEVISAVKEMRGKKDIEILSRAFEENRVVITSDKDFGDIVFNKKMQHCGIIFLKLTINTSNAKIKAIENLLKYHHDDIFGNFIVVSDTNIKVIKQFFH